MSSVKEGDRISNYLLEARVGAGSFGEVWRARHHVFGELVAIKIPTDTQYVRNLQREGVAIHGLRHPNIVRAIDLDPYADPPYLVMEYVDGPSLREAIDQYRNTFPVEAAVAVMRGVLHALSLAHENNVLHRDIKPANILLAQSLESLASITPQDVKVTDFGLGRVGDDTTKSIVQSGSIVTDCGGSVEGTIAYMSPEQKSGRDLDGRSDLYACGIVLFEMLIGERPQGTDLPGTLRSVVPVRLDEAYRKSYTRLDRRYASAAEMLSELEMPSPNHLRAEPTPVPGWHASGVPDRCPKCMSHVHRDDQFCIGCGQQLVASVPHCTSCKEVVHANDRFCIFCGNDLRVLKS